MSAESQRYLAPAKLNLGLEIVRRRADGYHELVTIFQTISLYDALTIDPAPAGTLRLHADPVLGGEENLVVRAAQQLAAQRATPVGATLTLSKGIPVAAGLGGGSSDAATTLRALNEQWQIGLSATDLAAIATTLGADVPFFLQGGTALATGIGEELTALPPLDPQWFVLLTPAIVLPPNKTRQLYAALQLTDFSDGRRTYAQATRLQQQQGLDPTLLYNSFTAPLERLFPDLRAWQERLLAAGAPFVIPSGSGPTLYTCVSTEAAGRAIIANLGETTATVHLAQAVTGSINLPDEPITARK